MNTSNDLFTKISMNIDAFDNVIIRTNTSTTRKVAQSDDDNNIATHTATNTIIDTICIQKQIRMPIVTLRQPLLRMRKLVRILVQILKLIQSRTNATSGTNSDTNTEY